MKNSVPTIIKYAKVELIPPKPSEFREIKQGIGNVICAYKNKSYKNLTIKVSLFICNMLYLFLENLFTFLFFSLLLMLLTIAYNGIPYQLRKILISFKKNSFFNLKKKVNLYGNINN